MPSAVEPGRVPGDDEYRKLTAERSELISKVNQLRRTESNLSSQKNLMEVRLQINHLLGRIDGYDDRLKKYQKPQN